MTLFVVLSLFHPKGVNESEPFRWISAVPSIHAPVPTKGGKWTFGVLDLLKFQMTRTAASHTVRNTHIGCDVNLVRLNGKENNHVEWIQSTKLIGQFLGQLPATEG